jgi:aconitate hydratase
MGVLPLQFVEGQSVATLGLTGDEVLSVRGVSAINHGDAPRSVVVEAVQPDGSTVTFDALVRIDTPGEADYFRHGGILPFVLRSLLDD